MKSIKELGFKKPTPIQSKVIPHLLFSNQDLIATAQTGTGKTAAFGLPLLQLTDTNSNKIQTLILCPTRELCLQIGKELSTYSKYLKSINILSVYGGAKIDKQIRSLKKGPQIIVGTPGRTKDLIRRKKLFLGNIKRLVLDESDEMLSMGFKDDLEFIIKSSSKEKQILLFSATMNSKVDAVTKKYMKNSLKISVASVNRAAENVDHIFYMVQARDRYEVVKRIADMNPKIYGIVFCRTRRETKEVANKLMNDQYNADTIHGDLTQNERDDVMRRFRKRQLQILVATDVAARGLDVEDLTHVINYNLPDDDEIYVHRSGRTGRAGRNGISIAIIHGREHRRIKEIERKSGISFKRQNVPNGLEICKKRLYTLIDKIEKVKVNEDQIEHFLPYIYDKLNWLDREQLIKHFVSTEFNRYLSYYRDASDINIKSDSREKVRRKKPKRKRRKFFGSKNNRRNRKRKSS
ncbi:MAG: DEAD/DEAH box helicase [Candidatus Neomarinimicrobiota bacterium]